MQYSAVCLSTVNRVTIKELTIKTNKNNTIKKYLKEFKLVVWYADSVVFFVVKHYCSCSMRAVLLLR